MELWQQGGQSTTLGSEELWVEESWVTMKLVKCHKWQLLRLTHWENSCLI